MFPLYTSCKCFSPVNRFYHAVFTNCFISKVEEDREAEASVLPRNTRSRRIFPRGRGMSAENQRPNPVPWHQGDNCNSTSKCISEDNYFIK